MRSSPRVSYFARVFRDGAPRERCGCWRIRVAKRGWNGNVQLMGCLLSMDRLHSMPQCHLERHDCMLLLPRPAQGNPFLLFASTVVFILLTFFLWVPALDSGLSIYGFPVLDRTYAGFGVCIRVDFMLIGLYLWNGMMRFTTQKGATKLKHKSEASRLPPVTLHSLSILLYPLRDV